MAKTLLSIKVDRDIKDEAQQLVKEIGVPLSTVMNAYLREFVREREVRFSASPRLRVRVEIAKMLDKIRGDVRKNKNASPRFKTARDASLWLGSA